MKNIASCIDHTLLQPTAKQADIIKLCQEGHDWGCASVCVHPCYVQLAAKQLVGSLCKVTTVIGFPLGMQHQRVKVFETEQALADGADEIDVVINIGAVKDKSYQLVFNELCSIRHISVFHTMKVILETAYLTDSEKQKVCQLILDSGADFVKTSTGFAPSGATFEDVHLLRTIVGTKIGVKASGGIRNLEIAQRMIQAGASRLGCSHTQEILFGAN